MGSGSVPPPLGPGTNFFNKYDLIRPIGTGSFGQVWLAKDQAVNHEYALKILNPGISITHQLMEAKVGHAFSHNNLVRVHQADVATDGTVVIAMEYLSNGSIATLANCHSFLPLRIAVRATLDLLQGLEHLHASGCFHNDIKPQNVLRGNSGQFLLGDYGIVGLSQNGNPVVPTTWYVLHGAPETVAGNGIEARTDVFQTGLCLFRLLTGLGTLEAQFNTLGEAQYQASLATGKLVTQADFPAHTPPAIRRIVLKAIAPNPSDRYQSALEMRRALEKCSFPGYWTVDAAGAWTGIGHKNTFRFESVQTSKTTFCFTAFRRNKESNRETKIAEFSKSALTHGESLRLNARFQRSVVDGSVV